MQEGLNEAFCLAIGLGGVGAGEDVTDAEKSECLGEAVGSVGTAIVGHHPFGLDALGAEPAQGPQEEACGGVLALVDQHLERLGGSRHPPRHEQSPSPRPGCGSQPLCR